MVRKNRKTRFNSKRVLIFILVTISVVLLSKFLSDSGDPVRCNLHSPYAILIRLDDRSTLLEKKSEEKIYPASLTKMMTALVAIENLKDLQQQTRLKASTILKLINKDASTAGFQPDEQVRAIDLLYGAMLPSGAECCIGLAEMVAGSEQGFVKMMNEKARSMGLNNTHFANTTGLHDKNHYTTVRDMAVLLCEALSNKTFREIFTTEKYTTSPTNMHPGGLTFYSTMFARLDDPSVNAGKILGGKTGYTHEAGLCLASLAKEKGKEYVLVTAGAKGDQQSEQYNITDAFAVYNSLSARE